MSPAAPHRDDVRAAVTPWTLEIIAARAPAGVEVIGLDTQPDLETIDFVVPAAVDTGVLRRLPELDRLSVIQSLSAGTDHFNGRVPEHATLCSARGARDAPMAEWILAALLGASSRLLERAGAREWDRGMHLEDLSEWRVIVVGMGSIGRLVGERLAGLGTDVVGVVSHAREGLHGVDELDTLLPGADAVVLLTPLTEATHGLMGAARLGAMRDGAVIVNAARGAVLDSDALLAETATGRLRAVLDVTDPEPLPDDHPLWRAPGVLSITPHIGGDSPRGHRQAAELAAAQLGRWCAGEPLHNVVQQGRQRAS